jgi:gamma-glutamyltranspeptidase/glutathione hydrolase
VLVFACLVLAACGDGGRTLRAVGFSDRHLGGVVADEPRAVVAARDALAAGGSAADAAVAYYFAAAVTFPSVASLGGGGVCVVYDPEENLAETLDFRAGTAAAGGAVAVPGTARGLFALHARYGVLPWAQVLSPADSLARLGHRVSRAFANDLVRARDLIAGSEELTRLVTRDGGRLLREGDAFEQLDLAASITLIRTRGPGVLYSGELGRRFTAAANARGGALDIEDLRAYRPVWRGTVSRDFGYSVLHAPAPPLTGGLALLQTWALLDDDDRFEDAGAEERPHLLAEVSARAAADRGRWLPGVANGIASGQILDEDHVERVMAGYEPGRRSFEGAAPGRDPSRDLSGEGAAGFLAIDGRGQSVACGVTSGGLFGVGRIAGNTGIVLASSRARDRNAAAALAPVLLINQNVGDFYFGAAPSGMAASPSVLAAVMARVLIDEAPLDTALAEPRLFFDGASGAVVVEAGAGGQTREALARRGYRVSETGDIGKINAIVCRDGFPPYPESCSFEIDGRGNGLAAIVQF